MSNSGVYRGVYRVKNNNESCISISRNMCRKSGNFICERHDCSKFFKKDDFVSYNCNNKNQGRPKCN